MRARTLVVVLAGVLVLAACGQQGGPAIVYPESRTVEVVEDYHGTPVSDPYRWLEDLESEETAAWVAAQNAVTDVYLGAIPEREVLRVRLTELWNYPRVGVPEPAGERIVYAANDGLENQDVLYVADDLESEATVLLDPNTLSDDGTVALSGTSISPDGRYLAYGLASGGSDWQEWRVREIATGRDLSDRLEWIKFNTPAWSRDGGGLYYARYPAPTEGTERAGANRDHSAWFHRLGTDQSVDVEVFRQPEGAGWLLGLDTTEDGRWVVVTARRGSDRQTALFVRRTSSPAGAEFRQLAGAFEGMHAFVGSEGDTLWLHTDLGAPLGRLIAAPLAAADASAWRELIPEGEHVLQSVEVIGESFVARTLEDAASRLALYDLDGGNRRELELGLLGSIAGGPNGARGSAIGWFGLVGFTTPGRVYRLDTAAGTAELVRAPEVAFDPDAFATEQVFYTSKDGTRVPMFVSFRKGLARDGANPTILHGYGGFNAPQTPRFRVPEIVWMERGGVFAVANLRGGGEYGRTWHDAGRLAHKQNVFDDFIAAGEYLIAEGWTSSDNLSLSGGSNGGLLVGAVVNQRPDLAAAAVPAVGVMDMLRFHRFTIGWAWVSDYGSPDDPEMFPVLAGYSPYHNLEPGTRFPAVLAMTADHDDRVVPSHTFKYIARLQAAQAGDAPILVRVETRAGHGAGKPVSKRIEEAADRLAFLVEVLDAR